MTFPSNLTWRGLAALALVFLTVGCGFQDVRYETPERGRRGPVRNQQAETVWGSDGFSLFGLGKKNTDEEGGAVGS
ncbi:MAG: hypothetical protein FJX35_13730, partial [Alphaproteobacteria bacterium]|nr:hypothetical protein [Alphaproteobacteria bacterium]